MKLLVGTTNRGKVIEIGEVLRELPIDLVTPDILSLAQPPEETGESLEENAIQKARFYFKEATIPTLADDSGIFVDALKGEMGVQTRRWGAGPEASDKEWIEYFLKRMKEEPNKRAEFVCSMAYIGDDGKVHTFEGRCGGTITECLEADYLPGLPISACFKPEGCDMVFSALPIAQKNIVSHRGKAAFELRSFLKKIL